jgi:hypothetical protein
MVDAFTKETSIRLYPGSPPIARFWLERRDLGYIS